MKFINCLKCGGRLLEGEEGSHVVIKCVKCSSLLEVFIGKNKVEISAREKIQQEPAK